MRNQTTVANLCMLFIFTAQMSRSQQTPAKPLSEHTYTAGERFDVAVHLKAPAKLAENVMADYHRNDPSKPSGAASTQPPAAIDFSCRGGVAVGQLNFTVTCTTNRTVAGGEYASDGVLTLMRPETGDSIRAPSPTRFPIVTIVPNPYDDLNLPEVASTTLVFSAQQALDDASQKSDQLLQALNAHFTGQIKDNKETRAYLSEIAERERRIIYDTRISYESASGIPQTAPIPIVFQDFDRRLKKLLTELGQDPVQLSRRRSSPGLVLASAQMPTVHESVTAKSQSSKINKSANDLAGILVDAVKGFLGMKNSGMTVFKWSLTTDVAGASVYISRLDEPETQLAGVTPMLDQKLDYARWMFWIDWNGCGKPQDVNPFLQSDIKMTVKKVGCKTR